MIIISHTEKTVLLKYSNIQLHVDLKLCLHRENNYVGCSRP